MAYNYNNKASRQNARHDGKKSANAPGSWFKNLTGGLMVFVNEGEGGPDDLFYSSTISTKQRVQEAKGQEKPIYANYYINVRFLSEEVPTKSGFITMDEGFLSTYIDKQGEAHITLFVNRWSK